MKAIAVKPPQQNSVHLAELDRPTLDSIPDGRGVLVRVLKVGVDATDREINEGLYGAPPPGSEFLVLGHEALGKVVEVGSAVKKVKPGDYVSCTVRRPGGSIYDQIGRNDVTSEETYYERGINLRHGYLTEYFVDDEEYIVRIPGRMKHLGVLAEPASVVAKGIEQAYLAQQRLQVWEPRVAFVLGAGQIGLLATLMLRLRGLEVFTFARTPAEDNLKAEIASEYGARYVSTKSTTPQQVADETGARPDIVFESTGHSGIAFGAMEYLNLNGVLIWSSITGGDATIEVPGDRINLEWVLGNKLLVGTVNGNWRHFEKGIADLALGEQMYPGVTQRILTHPVQGLENYAEMMALLETGQCLKVFVEVADDD
jgi:threonine dehydrogenase-like Zn-dependent dehydrogenase